MADRLALKGTGTRGALRLAGVGALAAMLAASPGRCAPKITAEVGWNSHAKAGRWNPVFVTVENPDKPVRGALRVRESDTPSRLASGVTYLRPVNLPTRSRQRHIIYAQAQQYIVMEVDLLDGRRSVARIKTPPHYMLSEQDRLFVVIGREPGSLSSLAVTGPSEQRVAYAEADFLPDLAQGYDPVDVLVLGDVPTRIPSEALRAMREWVAMGGTLVISGGANITRLRTPALSALLPVRVTGSRALSGLGVLSSLYRTPLPAGGVVVAEGTPLPGASVLLSQDGLPLAVSRRLGTGRVVFLAFDFEAFPVKGWAGQRAMWEDLLAPAQAAVPRPDDAVARAAMAMGQTQVPSFWIIGIFLIGYPVLLVPVNYFLLKRRRRLEWAWLTIPLIVVVFSLAAYGVGYAMKGGRCLLNRAAVIQGFAGTGQARATMMAGLFSPRKARYQVSAGARPVNAVVQPRSDSGKSGRITVTQRDDDIALAADIDMWAMRVFRVEAPVDLGPGIEADIVYADGAAQGEITNHTPYDLSDCFLLLGDREQPIGPLPSGKTVKVHFVARPQVGPAGSWAGGGTSYHGSTGGGDADQVGQRMKAELRTGLGLRALYPGPRDTSALLLVGWNQESLWPVKVRPGSDEKHHLNCFVIALPYRWAPSAGRLVIPAGAVPGVPVADSSARLRREPYDNVIRLMGGEMVWRYRMPDTVGDVRLDEINVAYDIRGSEPGEVQVYDWQREAWEVVEAIPAKASGGGAVVAGSKTLPARRYARRGRVQIKVKHTGHGAGLHIQALGVGFSGRAR